MDTVESATPREPQTGLIVKHEQTDPTIPVSRRDAALAYAKAGYPVFPCRANSKQPATKNGFKDATTDIAQIDAWWSQGDFNIGFEPGSRGMFVIDIDPRHGGDDSWAGFNADTPLPATRTVRTPSGGRHLYFMGSAPPTRAGILGPGLDVRSRGGYVLVPPSIVNGVEYRLEDALSPVQVPQRILAAIEANTKKHEPKAAVADIELDLPGNIAEAEKWLATQPAPVEGTASDTLYEQACWLFDLGLSPTRVLDMLEAHSPGYDRDDIANRVANALKHRQNAVGSHGAEGVLLKATEEWLAARAAGAAAGNDPYAKPRVKLRRGSEIGDRDVRWLWPGWFACGKFEVFGGSKGAGKSTIAYELAARLSAVGGKWPDGSPVDRPMNVLVWSGEDDPEDTIMPRFKVAGGNPDRLYYVDDIIVGGQTRHFDPAIDMPSLIDQAREIPDLGMIVIDPVVSAVAGDSHKNAETRRGLQPLADFAKDRGAVLIGITHFTKGTQGRNPVERITGSLAFGALPRIVFGAVKGDDASAPRSFVRLASNIGPDGGGFEYTLEQQCVPGRDYLAQRVIWGRTLHGDALSLLGATEKHVGRRVQAKAWLVALLERNDGRMQVDDIKRARSADADFSEETLRDAKGELQAEGLLKSKQNEGGTRGWTWMLLKQPPPTTPPAALLPVLW